METLKGHKLSIKMSYNFKSSVGTSSGSIQVYENVFSSQILSRWPTFSTEVFVLKTFLQNLSWLE
jgi:hypothetical protein